MPYSFETNCSTESDTIHWGKQTVLLYTTKQSRNYQQNRSYNIIPCHGITSEYAQNMSDNSVNLFWLISPQCPTLKGLKFILVFLLIGGFLNFSIYSVFVPVECILIFHCWLTYCLIRCKIFNFIFWRKQHIFPYVIYCSDSSRCVRVPEFCVYFCRVQFLLPRRRPLWLFNLLCKLRIFSALELIVHVI